MVVRGRLIYFLLHPPFMDIENGGSAERAQSYFCAVEEIREHYMTYKSFPNHYIYKLFDGHVNIPESCLAVILFLLLRMCCNMKDIQ